MLCCPCDQRLVGGQQDQALGLGDAEEQAVEGIAVSRGQLATETTHDEPVINSRDVVERRGLAVSHQPPGCREAASCQAVEMPGDLFVDLPRERGVHTRGEFPQLAPTAQTALASHWHQPDERLPIARDHHVPTLERLLDQPGELVLRLQHVDLDGVLQPQCRATEGFDIDAALAPDHMRLFQGGSNWR